MDTTPPRMPVGFLTTHHNEKNQLIGTYTADRGSFVTLSEICEGFTIPGSFCSDDNEVFDAKLPFVKVVVFCLFPDSRQQHTGRQYCIAFDERHVDAASKRLGQDKMAHCLLYSAICTATAHDKIVDSARLTLNISLLIESLNEGELNQVANSMSSTLRNYKP